jgi:SAM-dependent methyltransferase
MQLSSKQTVLAYLRGKNFSSVLDAPSGNGWLAEGLGGRASMDGIDLYADAPGYRNLWRHDLNLGLPRDLGVYDLVACCEGIEHVGNPLLLLAEFFNHLGAGGLLVVTTPNVWYPQARLQYLMRGFFPSFPALAGRIAAGTHMHITPWSWPQLHLYLTLAGFVDLELIPQPLSRPKHLHERVLAIPAQLYCRGRLRNAASPEERKFWRTAGSEASLLGRHLIVAARKP